VPLQREFQKLDSVSNPSCPLWEPLVVRPKLPSLFDKLCSHVCARCIYLHRIWDDQRALVDSDSAAPTVDFGASASLPGPNPRKRRRCRSPGHHDERARDDEFRSVVPANNGAGAVSSTDAAADACADACTASGAWSDFCTLARSDAEADTCADAGRWFAMQLLHKLCAVRRHGPDATRLPLLRIGLPRWRRRLHSGYEYCDGNGLPDACADTRSDACSVRGDDVVKGR